MVRRKDDETDYGRPTEFDPNFNGPSKHRSCTDILCLLLFATFIGCWAGIAIYAYVEGDPNTLLVPKDSKGLRCGLDIEVKDKPYLFFFDLTKCIGPEVPFTGCNTPQVCVEKCPSEVFSWDTDKLLEKLICDDKKPTSNSEAEELIKQNHCAKWYLPSQPFENRCIPSNFDDLGSLISKDQVSKAIKNIKLLSQAEEFGQNVVDDIIKSWWKIVVGLAIAVVTCIIYIFMMRWLAAVMMWISLIGVIALLSAGVYFSAKKYMELKDQVDTDNENLLEKKTTWMVLLVAASILLLIILLMILFLRKRILLAIALIKEGSRAIGSVTSALFFPIVYWVLQLAVILFALSVALFLATSGEPIYKVANLNAPITCGTDNYQNGTECSPAKMNENSDCYNQMVQNGGICKFHSIKTVPLYPYLQAFNVFGFFWGTFFVSALGQMILASVFATWYWTWNKSNNLPFFAITEATFRVLRYHIGTLAFGSLIITICRIIRVILEYIDHKLKKYDNAFTKAIICCLKCFFWCLEKFLKFINKNAYIMCAIHGKNFCGSAKDAFSLLMRNILRVFVLDKVTDFLFFIGKLVITMGVGALSYLLFATDLTAIDNTGLNYNLAPVIIIMICTYIIATVFFDVYSMAVDTLFLCFLEDCERNDGSAEKPYFMSRSLMRIFGKKNKFD